MPESSSDLSGKDLSSLQIFKRSKGGTEMINNIPIKAQIRGIEKDIANPKTPPQLKNGLMKRLDNLMMVM